MIRGYPEGVPAFDADAFMPEIKEGDDVLVKIEAVFLLKLPKIRKPQQIT